MAGEGQTVGPPGLVSTPLHSYFNHTAYKDVVVPPFTPPENYDRVTAMEAREDDILICTYSKSGTTWLQNMVYNLVGCPGGPMIQLDKQVPWLQAIPDAAIATKMPSPRVFKTHDLYSWLPEQFRSKKLIYCYRNPKDWVVSYYNHINSLNHLYWCDTVEKGDFNAYFTEIARKGDVCEFGLWEDHVEEWLAQSGTSPNILFLTYEDLTEDTGRELGRIAEFLGVELNEELREKVLQESKFETMQGNDAVNYSWFVDTKTKPFIRKGKVGGWKGQLSGDQEGELDEAVRKVVEAGGRIRCTLE
eukprot:sb/3467283/